MALLMLALVPFALISGPGAGMLNRLGWADRGESLTELFFSDHLALPDTISAGDVLSFDFSLRNREGSPTTYRWQALVGPTAAATSDDANTAVLDSGEVTLRDDDVAVIHVEGAPPTSPGDVVASVVLVERPETLHFPIRIEPAASD